MHSLLEPFKQMRSKHETRMSSTETWVSHGRLGWYPKHLSSLTLLTEYNRRVASGHFGLGLHLQNPRHKGTDTAENWGRADRLIDSRHMVKGKIVTGDPFSKHEIPIALSTMTSEQG
jgi:hypothetical protein